MPYRYEMLFDGFRLNYKLTTKNGSSVDEAILQTIQVVTTPFIFENIVFFFQGDRFGGALDGAARMFSHGLDSGMAPMEFVNDMRKKGELIMGIGHRVKSVRNLWH